MINIHIKYILNIYIHIYIIPIHVMAVKANITIRTLNTKQNTKGITIPQSVYQDSSFPFRDLQAPLIIEIQGDKLVISEEEEE